MCRQKRMARVQGSPVIIDFLEEFNFTESNDWRRYGVERASPETNINAAIIL